MQDITQPTYSADYILNLSTEDIILHKIKMKLAEIETLKADYYLLAGKQVDHILNGEKTNQFIYPSTKEIEINIAAFLKDIGNNTFKTNQIISRFHKQDMTKDIRNELTRRYSGRLTLMKKAKQIFSISIKGEKGDLFCTDESILMLL